MARAMLVTELPLVYVCDDSGMAELALGAPGVKDAGLEFGALDAPQRHCENLFSKN